MDCGNQSPELENDNRDAYYDIDACVDTLDTVEGVCNSFRRYTRFLGFLEFPGYHQWQQESQ